MLTVHHLRKSQSERIVWLCEELGLDYKLQCHDRDPATNLAPAAYKALHPLGVAPVIDDGELRLTESGAIVEYLIAVHGHGRLALAPTDPDFARYLYWLHAANGSLQPAMHRNMLLRRLDLPAGHALSAAHRARLDLVLAHIDTRLGMVPYLAGLAFTAADIMSVFSLTTMRHFYPLDLAPYVNIRAYLQRIGEREAYQRAMRKGDPQMVPMLA